MDYILVRNSLALPTLRDYRTEKLNKRERKRRYKWRFCENWAPVGQGAEYSLKSEQQIPGFYRILVLKSSVA